jgi:hypothetical protein
MIARFSDANADRWPLRATPPRHACHDAPPLKKGRPLEWKASLCYVAAQGPVRAVASLARIPPWRPEDILCARTSTGGSGCVPGTLESLGYWLTAAFVDFSDMAVKPLPDMSWITHYGKLWDTAEAFYSDGFLWRLRFS